MQVKSAYSETCVDGQLATIPSVFRDHSPKTGQWNLFIRDNYEQFCIKRSPAFKRRL